MIGDFLLRRVSDIYILVPLRKRIVDLNSIFALNETGAFIWRLLEEGLSEDEIVKRMVDEFDVSITQAKNDVHYFLQELIKHGLIGC
jgi:hypothetical protein